MTAQIEVGSRRESKGASARRLAAGAVWTVATFGAGQGFRLLTNVMLARLLAPELFGIMQIVHSLRTGMELVTDVGIGQNIVYNKDAENPDYYSTAWTLQLIRGAILGAVFCALAYPVARFYGVPVLGPVILVGSAALVIGGATSMSRFLLQRQMKFGLVAVVETAVAAIAFAGQVSFAWFMPNIWGLVFGSLTGVAAWAIGSHFLMPEIHERFHISAARARQILSFGKWIFLSSIVYFLSMNFDRLYFAKTIPLEMLGVYGIARTLSELAGAVVQQLGNQVIFPFLASHARMPRAELRTQFAPTRLRFLLVAAGGFAVFAASADLAIKLLYDQRYQAATWMLPVLVSGAWFTILAHINESSLLGLGRPAFNVAGNFAKLVFIVVGMMAAVPRYGVFGGVLVVAASDLFRYAPVFYGQVRERFSFGRQDLLATLVVIVGIALFQGLRWLAGFGVSYDVLGRLAGGSL